MYMVHLQIITKNITCLMYYNVIAKFIIFTICRFWCDNYVGIHAKILPGTFLRF